MAEVDVPTLEITTWCTMRVGCRYVFEFDKLISMEKIVQLLSELSGQKKEFIRLSRDGVIVPMDEKFSESTEFFMMIAEEWDDGKDSIDSNSLVEAMSALVDDEDEDGEVGCPQM